jgi:hypothetical protein
MKDFKIYISVGSVLLLIYLVAQFNRPNPVNWATTLSYNDKIPYGTYVFYNRLKDLFPGAQVKNISKSPYDVFTNGNLTSGSYIVIAQNATFSKIDFKEMVKYVSAGNSVFISAFNFDGYISDSLKLETGVEYDKKNPGLNFTNPQLKKAADYKFDNNISSQYFSKFDTARATSISQNQYGQSNYLRFKFGKGNLFLFANPQILTNYSLLKPGGGEYPAKVLSYLPVTDNIYWDLYQNHDVSADQSPMRVFFNNPGLQWAYYLSLASLLLFVIYEIKRRQRIIPVIEPLKNATVEFVSVVGKVYYEQRDNSNIAAKKIVYFSEHLRNVFGLKTGNYNNDFLVSFINKTGIDESLARDLVSHINYMSQQSRVSDHELIVLNQLIEKFYIQSGSYGK